MTNTVKLIISQFHLQTRLFKNVTDGITDGQSTRQMFPGANHPAWLTGHIVSSRFLFANLLGLKESEPFPALFQNGKGMDTEAKYPSMQNLKKDWESISEKIASALQNISDEALSAKLPNPVPSGNEVGDFVAFILHHEAYTIGQIGIYRRFLGLPAMSYA